MTASLVPPYPPFVGWAADAYPGESRSGLRAMVERHLAAGANFLWIGHNNPGVAERDKDEPGLSYAIYEETLEPASPCHEDARAILEAQLRLLEVCRELGVPVVLPIGYQIQMGKRWEARHPEHLRRDAEGHPIDWGGRSASFYSPVYREDIVRYYRWVAEEVVAPYRDIIQLINLADEPFGGDYSAPAEAAFRALHGYGFQEVGEDPERLRALGRFQSDMIVEYARWSAERWHEVCPEIPSTMSFCGFHGREENLMPTVVNLFRLTPPHFEITFDLYPRDGPMTEPITRGDITALWIFLTQLGGLSGRYDKPLWMWTTGNSWGTGQASPDKGYISDAVANHYYDVDRVVAAGGRLKGLAVWNYNIKNQGLYNDPNETTWEPDEMFERISATFAEIHPVMQRSLREPLAPSPALALYAPVEPGFLRLGRSRAAVAQLSQPETCPYDFTALELLAHLKEPFAVVGELDELPPSCRVFIALPDNADELPAEARSELRAWLKPGRTLLVAPGLAPLFGIAEPRREYVEQPCEGGLLLIADPHQAFRLDFADEHPDLKRRLFALEETEAIFHYEVPWRKFWYNLTGRDSLVRQRLAEGQRGLIIRRDGTVASDSSREKILQGVLPHHAFAMVHKPAGL